jgi:hypothetical protein
LCNSTAPRVMMSSLYRCRAVIQRRHDQWYHAGAKCMRPNAIMRVLSWVIYRQFVMQIRTGASSRTGSGRVHGEQADRFGFDPMSHDSFTNLDRELDLIIFSDWSTGRMHGGVVARMLRSK